MVINRFDACIVVLDRDPKVLSLGLTESTYIITFIHRSNINVRKNTKLKDKYMYMSHSQAHIKRKQIHRNKTAAYRFHSLTPKMK